MIKILAFLQRIRRLLYHFKVISRVQPVAPFLIVTANQIVSKGRDSVHNGGFVVKGKGGILEIGSYCAIGEGVKVILANHYYDYPAIEYDFYLKRFGELPYELEKEVNVIESDVWIGDNAIILPRVRIGTGAIVGAGAIVTMDVPPYAIVGGNPAKIIKYRFDEETIKMLLDSKWWEWDDNKIKENKEFFFKNLNKNEIY